MKAKIKLVWDQSSETVNDQPVFTSDEEDASGMNRVIRRTTHFATQHVEPGRCESFEQTSLRERVLWLAAPVRSLIEIVNTNRVMRRSSFEPMTPLRLVFGVSEATGINDQRSAVRGNFNIQQVVMTVASVAKWSTVEDEILLIAKIRFLIS